MIPDPKNIRPEHIDEEVNYAIGNVAAVASRLREAMETTDRELQLIILLSAQSILPTVVRQVDNAIANAMAWKFSR